LDEKKFVVATMNNSRTTEICFRVTEKILQDLLKIW